MEKEFSAGGEGWRYYSNLNCDSIVKRRLILFILGLLFGWNILLVPYPSDQMILSPSFWLVDA
jgi:hypothetical protein